MKKTLVVVALSLAAVNPQLVQAQSLLDRIGKAVSKANDTLQGNVPPASTVQPTSKQTAETQALLENVTATPELKADFAEASNLVERLVQTSACATNNSAWNSLNRVHQKPQSWPAYRRDYVARSTDSYHDTSTCHDIVRIVDLSKPAANALKFTAYYISPSSERASRQTFTLVKNSNGEWLVRNIDLVFS